MTTDNITTISEKRRKRIAELEAQLAVCQKDADRLNWLESNPRHAQTVIDGQVTDCVFYGISCAELVKLRDAIDAAMKDTSNG